MGRLNRKQQAFAREYIKDQNATAAAIRAGYSPKTANVQGPRLLGNVSVAERLAKLSAKLEEAAIKSTADVLSELAKMGWQDMPPEDVRPGDKLKALELYAKYIGMDRESRREQLPMFNIAIVLQGDT